MVLVFVLRVLFRGLRVGAGNGCEEGGSGVDRSANLIVILSQFSGGFKPIPCGCCPRPMKSGRSGNRIASEVPVYRGGQEILKGSELVLMVLIAHFCFVVVEFLTW